MAAVAAGGNSLRSAGTAALGLPMKGGGELDGGGAGFSMAPSPKLAAVAESSPKVADLQGQHAAESAKRQSVHARRRSDIQQMLLLEEASKGTEGPGHVKLPSIPLLQAQAAEQSALHDMAALGRVHALENLLQTGADRDRVDAFGRTPLHLAAAVGHDQVVRVFMRLGTKLDTRDLTGVTPMHLAAHNGHITVISALLEAKVDIDGVCGAGKTPLHHAVEGLQSKVCSHLVYSKADPEAKSESIPTPLMLAVLCGHTVVLDTLITIRCDPHAMDEHGCVPLHHAACKQRLEIMEVLFDRGARADVPDHWGLAPIHRAARAGEHEAVGRLIERKALVSTRTSVMRQTALHLAAMADELETIDVLVRMKAQLEAQDNRGFTPLHCAIEHKRLQALERLLLVGSARDMQTKTGDTALHLAVQKQSVPLVQCLLSNQSNVNTRGRGGQTALHVAAEINNMAAAMLMLEADPDKKKAEQEGDGRKEGGHQGGATSAAGSQPHAVSRPTLKRRTVRNVPPTVDSGAAHSSRASSKNRVGSKEGGGEGILGTAAKVKNVANPNAKDHKMQTPLHIAAWHGRPKLCQLLLQCSGEVDAVDEAGSTALTLSVTKDHDSTVKTLLRLLADPMKENPQGLGPLQQACISGAINVTRTLAEMKMMPKMDEAPWRRPLALAKFYGHDTIVQYFFKPVPRNRLNLHMVRGKQFTISATFMAVISEPACTAARLQAVEMMAVPEKHMQPQPQDEEDEEPVSPKKKLNQPASESSEDEPQSPGRTVTCPNVSSLVAPALLAIKKSEPPSPGGTSTSSLLASSAVASAAAAQLEENNNDAIQKDLQRMFEYARGIKVVSEREVTKEEWCNGLTVTLEGFSESTAYLLRMSALNDAGLAHGDVTMVCTTDSKGQVPRVQLPQPSSPSRRVNKRASGLSRLEEKRRDSAARRNSREERRNSRQERRASGAGIAQSMPNIAGLDAPL
eukprot:TRINITY_DN19737_c0_g1_i1.p1 TRINITY_DN19737_c0_g1~~TRINITY_DN19737_c0_g1_i1.p1  ORF type:complete len:968 (+),score=261.90 TRINITY_DN19737_c0_g1_i1:182-3085(+)